RAGLARRSLLRPRAPARMVLSSRPSAVRRNQRPVVVAFFVTARAEPGGAVCRHLVRIAAVAPRPPLRPRGGSEARRLGRGDRHRSVRAAGWIARGVAAILSGL